MSFLTKWQQNDRQGRLSHYENVRFCVDFARFFGRNFGHSI